MSSKNFAVPVSRRHILGGMALGGATMYMPSLASHAQAQPKIPKRLVLIMTGHASLYQKLKMRRPGMPEAGNWEMDLQGLPKEQWSHIYQPLWRHRKNLLLLDTLSNAVNLKQPDPRGHFGGPSTLFTSSNHVGGDPKVAGGPSLDQIVAKHVAVPGRLPSVDLGTGSGTMGFWASRGNALPVQRDPVKAFARIFPAGFEPPSGSGSGGDTSGNDRSSKLIKARASVLDIAKQSYERVAKDLGREDRLKLEAHRDAVRDLETRLVASGEGAAIANPLACKKPDSVPSAPKRPVLVDQMTRVIATSFACDMTRVASLQLHSGLSPSDFGASGDLHQDVAHHDDTVLRQNQLADMYRMHSEELATLMDHLASIPEPDGSTTLDHTIIVWGQECGSWIHDVTHLPIVVAGGGGFRMGRYIHFDQAPAKEKNGGTRQKDYTKLGPPMSHLLVSVARKMGLEVDRIGDATAGFSGRGVADVPLNRTLDVLD